MLRTCIFFHINYTFLYVLTFQFAHDQINNFFSNVNHYFLFLNGIKHVIYEHLLFRK